MRSRARTVWAWSASIGLHAVPLSAALLWQAPAQAPAVLVTPVDESEAPAAVWAGDTFDIDALPADMTAAVTRPSSAPGEAEDAGVSAVPPSPAAPPPARRIPTDPASGETPAQSSEREPVRRPATDAESTPVNAPRPPVARSEGAVGDEQPESDSSQTGARTYGAATAAAVSAPLGKGLLRVLPRAAFVQPIFHELPLGQKFQLRFAVDLDEQGHAVLPVRLDEGQPKVPWLEALLERAVLLLRGGAFSLPAGVSGPASSRFELELQVLQGVAASGDWAEPRDLAEIGRLVEPTRTQAGRAHFRYNSGREVELLLRLR